MKALFNQMYRSALFTALCASGLIHGLVLLALWLHPLHEQPFCCDLLSTTRGVSAALSVPPTLRVSLQSNPADEQVRATNLHPAPEDAPGSVAPVSRLSNATNESGRAQADKSLQKASALETEFGVIRTHFFDKSELNRFPVLSQPVRLNTDGLDIDELQIGHADLWLYISTSGQVVAVRNEFNSLTPATLQKVFDALKQAHFMPGYISGDAVPSKIRWRVVVENNSGFSTFSGE